MGSWVGAGARAGGWGRAREEGSGGRWAAPPPVPRAVAEPEAARPPSPSPAEAARVANMSYMLPHLHNGWQVDQAILSEEDRVVVIRFGHDWDPTCMKMDEVLYSIAEKVPHARQSARCLLSLALPVDRKT